MTALLRTRQFIWLVALGLLLLLSLLGFTSLRRSREAAASVHHTFEVTVALDATLAAMTDVESGQRGYLIGGDTRFLETYDAGRTRILENLKKVRFLTRDNSKQQARIDELETVVAEKLDFAAECIRLRRENLDFASFFGTGRGRNLMQNVRKLVEEMQAEENRLLSERTAHASQAEGLTLLVLGLGAISSVGLVLFSLSMVRRDLREVRVANEEIAVAEEKFRILADNASDLIRRISLSGQCLYVSPSVTRLLGYAPDEFCRLDSRSILHPDDYSRLDKEIEPMRQGDTVLQSFRARYLHKDGHYLWFELNVTPIHDAEGKMDGILVSSRDIQERVESEALLAERSEQLRLLSLTDALTGLSNRRGFLELATQQMKIGRREKRPMALVFVDLDGLKPINDNLGHEMGDRAIIEAARVLEVACRSSDVVARMGGDEFALFGLDLTPLNIGALRTRLEEALDLANTESSRKYRLSFSIGASFLGDDATETLDELIRRADDAMYLEKRARKAARDG